LANSIHGTSRPDAMRQNCVGKAADFVSFHRNGIAGEFVTNGTLQSIKLVESPRLKWRDGDARLSLQPEFSPLFFLLILLALY